MTASRNIFLTWFVIVTLMIDLALIGWLIILSFPQKAGSPSKPASREHGFVNSYGPRPGPVEPGYLLENGTGATAVGNLVSVWQDKKAMIGRFRFGNEDKAVEAEFVLGLFEPNHKLHLYVSQTKELNPTSDKMRYRQIEPGQIKEALAGYQNRLFRMSLTKPYDEQALRSKAVTQETVALIQKLNPYFLCNAQLIEANTSGRVQTPVNCRGGVFDLLTYAEK